MRNSADTRVYIHESELARSVGGRVGRRLQGADLVYFFHIAEISVCHRNRPTLVYNLRQKLGSAHHSIQNRGGGAFSLPALFLDDDAFLFYYLLLVTFIE